MGEQTMETQKKVSLTKKDLNKAYWTFETYAQACCSYERLQAPGFFSGMRNIQLSKRKSIVFPLIILTVILKGTPSLV